MNKGRDKVGAINEKLLEIRNEIIKPREKKDNIKKQIEKMVAELQDICNHESIMEARHVSTHNDILPPRRICLICGIEEDGWGYKILTEKPIRIVERKDFYTYRNHKSFKMKPVPTE